MVNEISFNKVNLHYSSEAYRPKSLKFVLSHFLKDEVKISASDIHALKDISFNIVSGEQVGLIGHNGAGKSTLLKTIAGLYPISSGSIKIQGDVRSLFELSLGFESEATGRENITYRGLLLGYTPEQITMIEEDIISFAAIGEFIDYPIKTYSAGMLVRLAFSISTTVQGQILLLDEVIGAGDALFMNKAKKRIKDLIEHAEIMILASHDFASIRELCNRILVMHHGDLIFDGDVELGIKEYNKVIGL
jgi:lipopolysaccharide transport system ATP-binding protein